MRHVLDVDELPAAQTDAILAAAADYRRLLDEDGTIEPALAGRRVALLFAEPSTRTRLSFEIAAGRLGAQTLVVDPGGSSLVKGESLADTARALGALGIDVMVIRHHRAGAAWVAARHFAGSVVNAGDGWHAHPTQALLDLFTLRRAFAGGPAQAKPLADRKVVIVGDLRHSRVARSNLWTLTADGVALWGCGPPDFLAGWEELAAALPSDRSLSLTDDLAAALRDADAVMALRIQRERMAAAAVDVDSYLAMYQITEAHMRLAAPGAVFMHPGPVNEGVEVTREVARGARSLVGEQVRNGVPVRMAVLAALDRAGARGTAADAVAVEAADAAAASPEAGPSAGSAGPDAGPEEDETAAGAGLGRAEAGTAGPSRPIFGD